jgi:hypothetical protein
MHDFLQTLSYPPQSGAARPGEPLRAVMRSFNETAVPGLADYFHAQSTSPLAFRSSARLRSGNQKARIKNRK